MDSVTPALPSSHLSPADVDFAYGVEKGCGLSPHTLEIPGGPSPSTPQGSPLDHRDHSSLAVGRIPPSEGVSTDHSEGFGPKK